MKGGALQKKKNDCLDERAKTKKADVLPILKLSFLQPGNANRAWHSDK